MANITTKVEPVWIPQIFPSTTCLYIRIELRPEVVEEAFGLSKIRVVSKPNGESENRGSLLFLLLTTSE